MAEKIIETGSRVKWKKPRGHPGERAWYIPFYSGRPPAGHAYAREVVWKRGRWRGTGREKDIPWEKLPRRYKKAYAPREPPPKEIGALAEPSKKQGMAEKSTKLAAGILRGEITKKEQRAVTTGRAELEDVAAAGSQLPGEEEQKPKEKIAKKPEKEAKPKKKKPEKKAKPSRKGYYTGAAINKAAGKPVVAPKARLSPQRAKEILTKRGYKVTATKKELRVARPEPERATTGGLPQKTVARGVMKARGPAKPQEAVARGVMEAGEPSEKGMGEYFKPTGLIKGIEALEERGAIPTWKAREYKKAATWGAQKTAYIPAGGALPFLFRGAGKAAVKTGLARTTEGAVRKVGTAATGLMGIAWGAERAKTYREKGGKATAEKLVGTDIPMFLGMGVGYKAGAKLIAKMKRQPKSMTEAIEMSMRQRPVRQRVEVEGGRTTETEKVVDLTGKKAREKVEVKGKAARMQAQVLGYKRKTARTPWEVKERGALKQQRTQEGILSLVGRGEERGIKAEKKGTYIEEAIVSTRGKAKSRARLPGKEQPKVETAVRKGESGVPPQVARAREVKEFRPREKPRKPPKARWEGRSQRIYGRRPKPEGRLKPELPALTTVIQEPERLERREPGKVAPAPRERLPGVTRMAETVTAPATRRAERATQRYKQRRKAKQKKKATTITRQRRRAKQREKVVTGKSLLEQVEETTTGTTRPLGGRLPGGDGGGAKGGKKPLLPLLAGAEVVGGGFFGKRWGGRKATKYRSFAASIAFGSKGRPRVRGSPLINILGGGKKYVQHKEAIEKSPRERVFDLGGIGLFGKTKETRLPRKRSKRVKRKGIFNSNRLLFGSVGKKKPKPKKKAKGGRVRPFKLVLPQVLIWGNKRKAKKKKR